MLKNLNKIFTPLQLLTLGFLIIIFGGAILLMLPFSTNNGESQTFIDALFTSTSAVSTTGLIVVDTPTYYSFFGQMVILILIQIGGLGYMIFFVLTILLIKNKLSINKKKYLRESMSRLPIVELIKFAKLTILFTLIIEITGAINYYLVFIKEYDFLSAIFYSIFHSISAFCTAGFSLFSDSLCGYRNDIFINVNTFFLVIAGSIGFFVLYNISRYFKLLFKRNPIRKLTLQTKIVISASLSLFLVGAILLLFFESNKFSENYLQRTLISVFQSITASTTVGFNTIDIGLLSNASLFVIIILMFIGGSPGSTAGGIKTIAFTVFSKFSIEKLRGKNKVSIFKRNISFEVFDKSVAQIFVSVSSIIFILLILTMTEKFDFIKLLFEAVSAFGTVGLSTGITPQLTLIGKIGIITLMFIGRIGPLAIGLSLFPKAKTNMYKYPDEELLIS